MKRIAVLPHAFARRVAALDKPVRMGLAGALALSTIAAGSLVYAASASAAVPAFPDNIVVFPDRDFVSIEGYQDKVGSTATIVVKRNGEITGMGEGTISAGDPAIEVNHPGGVCWGTGTNAPNVTPDIRAGDVVELLIDGEPVGETTTGSGTLANSGTVPGDKFSGPAVERNGGTLLIRGTVGADIVLAQGEQRIIAPDLVDTDVQRRDVRAVPSDTLVPAPRGGYSSMLEFENDTLPTGPTRFLATYEFEDGANNTAVELATIAAAGGPRYMSWQVEDLDANRQGLTIAEFGEAGGPGMGGCPNGPLQSGPPAPTNITATKTTAGPGETVTFAWTPAVPVPGTPAITGYRVRAVGAVDVDGNQPEVGLRVNDPAATGAVLQVPFTPYTLEVTSRNAENNETNPPAPAVANPPDTTAPDAPTITPGSGAFVGATEFTIDAEQGADIFYQLTTGPTEPILHLGGGILSGDETLYTGPLTLDTDTRLSAVAVDAAGNVSDQTDVELTFSTASPPVDQPVVGQPTAGNGSFTVTWTEVTATPAVTGYVIAWTGPENGSVDVGTTPLSKTVTGLDPGQYTVTVAAKNVGGTGEPSDGQIVNVGEDFSVSAGADTTVNRGGAAVTLEATTPNGNVTYLWERVTSNAVNADVVASPTYLTGATTDSPTVTLPNVALPTSNTLTPAQAADARATALFYRVTLLRDGLPVAQDVVRVAVNQATVTIATGRYRAGSELRLEGSVTNAGATVRVYSRANGADDSVNYTFIGTATVTAAPGGGATWSLRLRNGAVPPNRPWYAFSSAGGGFGPFNT